MEEGSTEEEGTGATRPDLPKPRARPPVRAQLTRLGHFQLLEPLGHGGMGTVYSAYDLRLDRKVAIKLLTDATSPEHLAARNQRLLREAQAMAKLSHPNVVPVYEVGIDRDTVFIAMEFIAGDTLASWLAGGKPAWPAIVDVFVQAGRGLAAAHEANIVHRDFKPANVLVDTRGHVRVADFGIAQVHGWSDARDESQPIPRVSALDHDELTPVPPSTPLTDEGSVVGTPAYMSPEQHRGARLDARSDQFSFCVTLYEALYGKRPFQGRGKELAENIKAGAIEKPDPKAAVPGWLATIVMRGLEVDPDRRFSTMAALVAALSHDPRRTRRLVLGGAGVIALAASAAFAAWRITSQREEPCSGAAEHFAGVWDPAVRGAVEHGFTATHVPYAEATLHGVEAALDGYRDRWVAMHTEACRATRVHAEQSEHVLDLRMACLERRLGEARALTTLLATTADAHDVEHAVEAASSLPSIAVCSDSLALAQPGIAPRDAAARQRRAELQERLDHVLALRRLGRFKDALAPTRALAADARAANDAVVLGQTLDLEGMLETRTGDLKAAEASLGEALHRTHQLGDADLFVTATMDLADMLGEYGITRSREGLGVLVVADALAPETHDPALRVQLAVSRADLWLTLAHAENALPLLETALDQAQRAFGKDHPVTFEVQKFYGAALRHVQRYSEMAAVYDALIAGSTRVLGASHPATLVARLQRCRDLTYGNALEQGPACFAAVIPDALHVLGNHDRELISFRSDQGLALYNLGKLDEAKQVLSSVLADLPDDAWHDRWFVASMIGRVLGLTEVALGEFQAGLAHCEKAQASDERGHGGPPDATCIGEALLGLGDSARAVTVLEQQKQTIETTDPAQLGVDPSQIGSWRFAYARALWAARHDAVQARAQAEKARGELAPARRDQLDAWLATLPR